jgi:hypothetical protein
LLLYASYDEDRAVHSTNYRDQKAGKVNHKEGHGYMRKGNTINIFGSCVTTSDTKLARNWNPTATTQQCSIWQWTIGKMTYHRDDWRRTRLMLTQDQK